LNELATDDRCRAAADRLVSAFGARLQSRPPNLGEMLLGMDFSGGPAKLSVLVVPESSAGERELLRVVRESHVPNLLLVLVSEGKELERHARTVPLVRGKSVRNGVATAYVCEH
jgi:uncharacterized protein YyaL (SSP411 family)